MPNKEVGMSDENEYYGNENDEQPSRMPKGLLLGLAVGLLIVLSYFGMQHNQSTVDNEIVGLYLVNIEDCEIGRGAKGAVDRSSTVHEGALRACYNDMDPAQFALCQTTAKGRMCEATLQGVLWHSLSQGSAKGLVKWRKENAPRDEGTDATVEVEEEEGPSPSTGASTDENNHAVIVDCDNDAVFKQVDACTEDGTRVRGKIRVTEIRDDD